MRTDVFSNFFVLLSSSSTLITSSFIHHFSSVFLLTQHHHRHSFIHQCLLIHQKRSSLKFHHQLEVKWRKRKCTRPIMFPGYSSLEALPLAWFRLPTLGKSNNMHPKAFRGNHSHLPPPCIYHPDPQMICSLQGHQ